MLQIVEQPRPANYGPAKRAQFGWTEDSDVPTLEWIDKTKLMVDDDYQRTVTQERVRALASTWSWVACAALVVVRRSDGRYAVVDGQHRLLAAMRRTEITQLPCCVFDHREIKDEAAGFVAANCNRKAMNSIDRHRAAVLAGDAAAVKVQEILTAAGLKASHGGEGVFPQLRAISACYRLVRGPKNRLATVLEVCKECSAGGLPVTDKVILGLAFIDNHCDGAENVLDDPRMRERLNELTSPVIHAAAQRAAAFYTTGGERVYARGILDAVNKGLRNRWKLKGDE